MIIKTKRFSLDKKLYVKKAFAAQLKVIWKWLFIPLAVAILGLILHFTGTYKNWWIIIVAIIGAALFILFWYIQFYAATQLDQNKQMFEKFIYEIDSRQILVKINAKEGGTIKWDTITSAEKDETGYFLHIARGQFLHFPYSVFTSDQDQKLLESILRRKSLFV